MTAPFPPFDPRTSDGCTGVRDIAGWACLEHDRDYWSGWRIRHKLAADWRLWANIAGHPWSRRLHLTEPLPVFVLMVCWYPILGLVRFAGVLILPSAWRAFYGKPHKRGLWKTLGRRLVW